MLKGIGLSVAIVLAVMAQGGSAQAQATRTWVSGVGDDVNPCSRTAPCKTFAGAISKTAAGGEISVLDPGGFGAVTITKSISLVAEGVEGSILATGTNGIIVNAGPTDRVSVRGILIEGAVTGVSGIRFIAGSSLHVENTVIRGFRGGSGIGIDHQNPGLSRLHVRNTSIYENTIGINVKAAGAATNAFFLEGSVVQSNATNIRVEGAKSIVNLTDSTIAGGLGITVLNNGVVRSYGNNVIANGAPTETLPLQ